MLVVLPYGDTPSTVFRMWAQDGTYGLIGQDGRLATVAAELQRFHAAMTG